MAKITHVHVFPGKNGMYGIEQQGAIVYDPFFPKATALRIAALENGPNPPQDWPQTRDILQAEGLPLGALA